MVKKLKLGWVGPEIRRKMCGRGEMKEPLTEHYPKEKHLVFSRGFHAFEPPLGKGKAGPHSLSPEKEPGPSTGSPRILPRTRHPG